MRSGDAVLLRTDGGAYVDVQGDMGGVVRVRQGQPRKWRQLVLEKAGGGLIESGDTVYFKAHTGNFIDVQGEDSWSSILRARWSRREHWQALKIERGAGDGSLRSGDVVFLAAHTGNYVGISGGDQVLHADAKYSGAGMAFVVQDAEEASSSSPEEERHGGGDGGTEASTTSKASAVAEGVLLVRAGLRGAEAPSSADGQALRSAFVRRVAAPLLGLRGEAKAVRHMQSAVLACGGGGSGGDSGGAAGGPGFMVEVCVPRASLGRHEIPGLFELREAARGEAIRRAARDALAAAGASADAAAALAAGGGFHVSVDVGRSCPGERHEPVFCPPAALARIATTTTTLSTSATATTTSSTSAQTTTALATTSTPATTTPATTTTAQTTPASSTTTVTTLPATATATTTTVTTTPETTRTTTVDRTPVSMAELQTRFGAAVRDSPIDAFASLDADSDGYSTLHEFSSASQSWASPLSAPQAEAAFAALDADADGRVAAAEFLGASAAGAFRGTRAAGRKAPQKIPLSRYRECLGSISRTGTGTSSLKAYDDDMDGVLDLGEFLQAMAHCEPPLTRAEAEYAMRGLDVDEDGWLDDLEFQALHLEGFFEPLGVETRLDG